MDPLRNYKSPPTAEETRKSYGVDLPIQLAFLALLIAVGLFCYLRYANP